MQRTKRKRLTLLVAALGLALVPLASAADGTSVDKGDADAAATRRAAGRLDLPGPLMPGNMAGLLLRDGQATFELDAVLLRDAEDESGGAIRGGARRLHGPNAGRLFRLHGVWESDGQGRGRYHAVLIPLPPANAEQGTEPEAVVRLHGPFRDPNGPALPPGHFRGRWSRVGDDVDG